MKSFKILFLITTFIFPSFIFAADCADYVDCVASEGGASESGATDCVASEGSRQRESVDVASGGRKEQEQVSQELIRATSAMPNRSSKWAKKRFLPRHKETLRRKQEMNNEVDLVFLGDSIIHYWEKKGGSSVWETFYGKRKALNLGSEGDRTEHVLWRIENGAIADIDPKLLILMIGTNNLTSRLDIDTPKDTALGIKKILDELKLRLPKTKILLLGTFPRSPNPSDEPRVKNRALNEIIKHYADEKVIFWLDISNSFLNQNGFLTKEIMKDFVHIQSEASFKIWAEAMEEKIKGLMMVE